MSWDLLYRIVVTTLLWGGACSAVVLFWFYGLPVVLRLHRAFAFWLAEDPRRMLFAVLGAFGAGLLILLWVGIFELAGRVLSHVCAIPYLAGSGEHRRPTPEMERRVEDLAAESRRRDPERLRRAIDEAAAGLPGGVSAIAIGMLKPKAERDRIDAIRRRSHELAVQRGHIRVLGRSLSASPAWRCWCPPWWRQSPYRRPSRTRSCPS